VGEQLRSLHGPRNRLFCARDVSHQGGGLLFAQTKGRVIVLKVVADWRDVNAPAAHRFARGSHVTPTDKRTATRSWQATIFRLSG